MSGPFGIRRPLRFLSHKLGLDAKQTGRLAELLDDLRTERAQADVDRHRAQKAYAEAVKTDSFDSERAQEAATDRVAAAERVEQARVHALGELHALLDDDQRRTLAVLLRAGPLSF